MRRSHLLVPVVASILLFWPPQLVVAQQMQAPRDTLWWHVSYHQVDWNRVDSLNKLIRAYSLPAATEAKRMGTLVDFRVLTHVYGSEYNVQVIRQFRRFADINTDTTFRAAFRRLQPDSIRRRTIQDALTWAIGGGPHRDEIFLEVRQ